MAIPTYEYTTLKKVIAKAKTRLMPFGMTVDTTWDVFLKDAAIEAAEEMMTALDFNEYTATLEICDFVAILPKNFVTFDRSGSLVFTTDGVVNNGTQLTPYNSGYGVVYTGAPFVTNSPFIGGIQDGYIPTINIQDGKIYFSNNITNTECTISYLGVNIDSNGDMQIPKMNERPIRYFIMAEWKRANGINGWQTDQALWSQGKRDRRGKANLGTAFQRDAAIRAWNALLG